MPPIFTARTCSEGFAFIEPSPSGTEIRVYESFVRGLDFDDRLELPLTPSVSRGDSPPKRRRRRLYLR